MSATEKFETVNLISFYEENGKKRYRLLESPLENEGPNIEKEITTGEVYKDGEAMIEVWKYIESNLKQ